ncbi:MAG: Lrp/AsnC family transcriptional regulator [Candidatus Nanoarchaeia archaeon]|nr:Lrp/AsnC family transcriptional regulator [Candidatus Nanoarchaeia archaeon]MDD5740430.1 Lrp/AsnC family transcriptional regulator [Candidatus Nanoarchaeia archaeon]
MRCLQQKQDTKEIKLDVKDIKILALLSNNARIPLTQLSKKVALSRDAVDYRIKNYEKSGLIQGYRTIINVAEFGYNNYHLFIKLNNPSEEIEKRILSRLIKHDFIRAILKFSGGFDFEIAIIAKDLEELDKRIENITRDCSGFVQDYEILTFSKFYASRTLPKSFSNIIEDLEIKKKQYKIDKKDIEILKLISENALLPLYEIGNKIKLSADAISYRIKKMRESKIINKFIPVVDYSLLGYNVFVVLFDINSLNEERGKKLGEFFIHDNNTIWAVKTIGKFNVLVYFLVKNIDDLQKSISKLRSMFPGEVRNHNVLIAYEEYKFTYFPPGLF